VAWLQKQVFRRQIGATNSRYQLYAVSPSLWHLLHPMHAL